MTEYQLYTHHKTIKPTTENLKIYLIGEIKDQLNEKKDRLWIKKLLSFEDQEVSYLLYKIDKNYKLAL